MFSIIGSPFYKIGYGLFLEYLGIKKAVRIRFELIKFVRKSKIVLADKTEVFFRAKYLINLFFSLRA